MAGKSKRAVLVLTQEQRARLKVLPGSRTAPVREVERAKILIGYAGGAGFPRLARAGKSTVWRILDENQIKPHRIHYYLEKRSDRNFLFGRGH